VAKEQLDGWMQIINFGRALKMDFSEQRVLRGSRTNSNHFTFSGI